MKELQLGILDKKWLQTQEIVIYGFGVIARKCIDMLMEDFTIPYIVDNSPKMKGTFYKGIPIISQEEMKKQGQIYPIVIIGTIGVYKSISAMLEQDGFAENKDFCIVDLFVAEWYWYNKKQVHLVEVHTSVTTRCTLQCKNCNMFMPYYKQHKDSDVAMFKQDMDQLFRVVDKVFSIGILGGEPLLNKDLADMIEYLHENYRNRIGEISVITNGTLLPDDKLLNVWKKCNVRIHISDYTKTVPYEKRLQEFEQLMKANHVEYRINSSLVWCDFGFPENSFHFKDVRTHMMECFPVFRGLNESKMYFCHVAWSAEKCGLYQLKESDYCNIAEIDEKKDEQRKEFLNMSLGGKQDWFLSFCKVCGGCGADNTKYIKAGLQVKREGEL